MSSIIWMTNEYYVKIFIFLHILKKRSQNLLVILVFLKQILVYNMPPLYTGEAWVPGGACWAAGAGGEEEEQDYPALYS